jgi:GGDEF domain-containing protein
MLIKIAATMEIKLNERIGSMVIRSQTIQKGTTNCEAMNEIFKKSPSIDHVVILKEEKPEAMVVRQHFYTETGGPFGYQLFRKKPVEQICKNKPLIVDECLSVTSLAKLAMERFREDLYDPVIVVRRDGTFAGTVTMKQVIEKSLELEVRWARNVNPLTQLPGNEMIHNWIHDILLLPEYTIIYADLDHFKEFNDNYGFLVGDEFLSMTAKVLSGSLEVLPTGAKLGHVGGDDFVLVCPGLVDEIPVKSICEVFDQEKLELFKSEHRQKGFMEATDRQGMQIIIPLVTISLAVIDSRKIRKDPHPALFSEIAASIKKKVKKITAETGRSAFLFEQRSWV